ncbi:MAG: hypothetical protein GY821_01705 [Gammaproteobacteria bacterium]|nr:hypothetical protein [Gammaproteobacteria bacterium]
MSLDTSSFDEQVVGESVTMVIDNSHPLIKLAQRLPWQEILKIVLPDIKKTEKLKWWRGRPLRLRIHLGVYLLQQIFDLKDRQAERLVRGVVF